MLKFNKNMISLRYPRIIAALKEVLICPVALLPSPAMPGIRIGVLCPTFSGGLPFSNFYE